MVKDTKIVTFIKIIYQSMVNTIKHDGIEHAGYLSFLLMLAIFPFLVFFTAIIGTLSNLVDIPLVTTLTNVIINSSWASFIDSLKPRIIEITTLPPQNFLTIAIISAIWTASSIFEGIRTTLNRAYNIKNPPAYLFRRLFSILEFIIVIIILAVVILILIVIPAIWNFLEKHIIIPDTQIISLIDRDLEVLRSAILYLFSIIFVSYLYYSLLNKKQKFIKILPGTVLVLFCWAIFSKIFKYYISYFSQINMIYGSIAGVIISLLFFYFCSLILIYGAEFNYLFESKFKKKK
ncbi:MAG: YihY/virulence factor BrkB family protein [Candidatus Midichloria sp.]|nr:MAG: YihY/virulence factor BrkB family protein [Candidatus Midichloria sp.]